MFPDPNTLGAGVVVSILVSELLQIVKESPCCPWVTKDTQRANRIIGAVAAVLTGLGIHLSFDATAGQLVVTGLAWASIGHAALQWAQQQFYYRALIRESKGANGAAMHGH